MNQKNANQNKWEENIYKVKELYEASPVPPQYDAKVQAAIQQNKVPKARLKWLRSTACAACAVMLMATAGLNLSPAFALAASDVPLLGGIAQVLTFRTYENRNSQADINARIPEVSQMTDKELQAKINAEIKAKTDAVLTEAEKRAAEEQKAYLETGGKLEEFTPVMIDIDYTVYHQSAQMLSFVVNCTETRANAYTEQHFYNIDLVGNKELTLKDMLGEGYIALANAQITAQIAERAKDPNNMYFDGSEGIDGFSTIAEDQKFYINKSGNAVVIFNKYEIAPGYMGIQEFEILKMQ